VGDGTLAFRYDVELALVMIEALSELPIPPFVLRVNNRKLAEGFYRGVGLTDAPAVLREIDKLEKIGAEQVSRNLQDTVGATPEQAEAALSLAAIRTEDTSFVERVRELGVSNNLLDEGLNELAEVVGEASRRAPGKVVADLSIARGLDYYTGTVYETVLVGHEQLGSVCSGGRYESLASSGKKTYPGVGLSIGVTRLVTRILSRSMAQASRSVPSAVLVALNDDASWSAAQDVAGQLRARGIATEVAATAQKFGKQIRYAERRGIPFVWFSSVAEEGSPTHEVKDIRSGEQVAADPASWQPPAEDLHATVLRAATTDD
ncbi:histidine--tRNA ligase family protein, partial [Streptomyces sp. tea 10]|nr:histidine--tRNA ligase family protein [Streptomyces sp. tea 10]